jgi:cell division protein FtsZ
MGGGTGTGAAPVIARMARERNILTVGVVTKPFTFEGSRRARAAEAGIEELQQFVDTLIVIPNQNLFRLANERTGWKEAFKMADNVLYMGVRGVTDLMVAPGLVNLDFADIRTVMAEMGKAMMGTGEAEGENRAVRAAEAAISNPLLEDTSMAGARGLLINITGGEDLTLFEVDQAANRIREEVDEEANIIFGSAIDDVLHGKIRVSVVATGIETAHQRTAERPRLVAVGGDTMPRAEAPAEGAASTPAPVMAGGEPERSPLRVASPPIPGAAPIMVASTPATRVPVPLPVQKLQAAAAAHAAAQAAALRAAPEPAEPEERAPLAAPARAPRPAPAPGVSRFAQPQPQRNGLFAEPQAVAAPAHPPRKSIFGLVTGAIRGGHAPAAAPDAGNEPARMPATEPRLADARLADPRVADARVADARLAEPRLEPAMERGRVNVRQTAGDDVNIDIPAFLRRQSS